MNCIYFRRMKRAKRYTFPYDCTVPGTVLKKSELQYIRDVQCYVTLQGRWSVPLEMLGQNPKPQRPSEQCENIIKHHPSEK
jgi:hypothetical protein